MPYKTSIICSHFFFQTDERKSREIERQPAGTPTADRVFVSTAPMKSAVSVTKLPLIWQFLSSRIRRSPTGAVGITYALTSRRRCFRNSIARGGSHFPRKRRYAQMWGAGAKCDFACASDYNLPPSLREVSRQSRDGGSSCPPCAREGGAAELRRKGCLAIIRCKRRHCVMPFHLGGTKVVCRLGHEIAAEMAIS